MVRKVMIEFSLVPESVSTKAGKIENEISEAFRKGFIIIPWCYYIETIKVIEK